MIAFDVDGVRFHFRLGGIAVKDGKVLLNRGRGPDYWFLPGGRIDGGEDSAAALRREMLEKLPGTTVYPDCVKAVIIGEESAPRLLVKDI